MKFTNRNTTLVTQCDSNFYFKPITTEYVCRQLSKLCIAKATGIDNVSARLLKYAAPYISFSLTFKLLICLYRQDRFLQSGNDLGLCHYLKKGVELTFVTTDKYLYILLEVSKILERAVHDQLYSYLDENDIVNRCQSGFRPGYSTATALLMFRYLI